MLKRLIDTENSSPALILRLALAVVIFPHGAQKVLGWFGGYGFSGTLGYFTETLGIPAPFAILVFAAEFLAPLGLAIGLLARPAAAGILAVMTGALFVHLPNGFFMNWSGQQAGEGFEFHLLAIAVAAGVVLLGAGAYSVDRWLVRQSKASRRRQSERPVLSLG